MCGTSLKIAPTKPESLIRNGIGKSTFIGALVRHELPGIPRDITIGCVEQEISEDDFDLEAINAVLAVDNERMELLEEERKLFGKPQVRNRRATRSINSNKSHAGFILLLFTCRVHCLHQVIVSTQTSAPNEYAFFQISAD